MNLNNRDDRTLLILFISLALMIAFGLFSCNPVKKVLRSKEMTEEVVNGYLKENPPKTEYKEGKVIIKDSTVRDTIPLPYPVNERYETHHYHETHRVDTVVDRTFEAVMSKRIDKLETDFAAMKEDRDEWKHKAQSRLYWLLLIGGIALGGGIIYVVKIVQPKITIGKS